MAFSTVQRPLHLYILTVVVFAALWLARSRATTGPLHDEAITLLAANAAEGQYAELRDSSSEPFGVVVSAGVWQRFTTIQGPLPFVRIRDDLRGHDLHPPLAFLLYNRWLSLWRAGSYQQGLLLSGLLVLFAVIALQRSLALVTRDPVAASTAALLCALSECVVVTSVYVRQYALLDLIVALTLLMTLRLLREDSRPGLLSVAALGALSLAGMLTQYLYVVATGSLHLAVIGVLTRRRSWRLLVCLLASYLLAGITFLTVLPDAPSGVGGALRRSQPLALNGRALSDLAHAVLPLPGSLPDGARQATAALTAAAVVLGVILAWRRSGLANRVAMGSLSVAVTSQVGLVAYGVFPPWATGPVYMFTLVALLAFAVAVMFQSSEAWKVAFAALAGVLLLGCHGALVISRLRAATRTQAGYVRLVRPDVVVIDGVERGHVLPLTLAMPPDQKVLVGRPRILQTWLDAAPDAADRVLWLTVPTTPPSPSFASEARGWCVKQLPTRQVGLYDAFLLTRPEPACLT